jgi:hypothetical protein
MEDIVKMVDHLPEGFTSWLKFYHRIKKDLEREFKTLPTHNENIFWSVIKAGEKPVNYGYSLHTIKAHAFDEIMAKLPNQETMLDIAKDYRSRQGFGNDEMASVLSRISMICPDKE